MLRRLHIVLTVLCLFPSALRAQESPRDSAFRLGFCSQTPVDSAAWSRLVETPDVPASIRRGPLPHPPLDFRDADGQYRGRVVLTLMVDTNGRVVRNSVSVAASTDARLSQWACTAADQIAFTPATVGGKPVLTMFDLPLTYSFGESPPDLE